MFVCNVCGATSKASLEKLHREIPSCNACGSTLRWRSVVAALSIELFGESLVIARWPANSRITGIGMSDWEGYARRMADRIGYHNTYYHKEPRLDITQPIPPELRNRFDFVISSDVYEHIPPPSAPAFTHALELLKPGGVFVLTVPLNATGHTVEHFPALWHWEVVRLGDVPVLVNRAANGALQVFDNPTLHGGDGLVVEMRKFSLPDLREQLGEAGFENIRVFEADDREHGVVAGLEHEPPILANAPQAPARGLKATFGRLREPRT